MSLVYTMQRLSRDYTGVPFDYLAKTRLAPAERISAKHLFVVSPGLGPFL